jgi:hypothetical protein
LWWTLLNPLNKYSWHIYQPGDLEKLELLSDEREHILASEAFYNQLAAVHDGSRRFFGTAWWGDKIVAIGGWWEKSPGIAEGMFVPDARILREHPLAFARSFKRWIAYIQTLPWCRRIQTHSVPTSKIDSFMEALGFVYEKTINTYNQDYKLWSREKINGTWGR